MPLASAFGPNSISLHSQAKSFHEAVTFAVGNLIADQAVTPDYLVDVIANLESLGPYFVVAPGIAIAHAKPSEFVFRNAWALAKFDQGVTSGSHNDPVQLVFAFCATDSSSHLELLAEFANWMATPGLVNSLQNASAESVIRNLL